MNVVPPQFVFVTDLPGVEDPEFLEKLERVAHQELVAERAARFTMLEQFISDFQVFGLREAIAYLLSDPELPVNQVTKRSMFKSYGLLLSEFQRHERAVVKSLSVTRAAAVRRNTDQMSLLERMIVVHALRNEDVLGDGERQTYHGDAVKSRRGRLKNGPKDV